MKGDRIQATVLSIQEIPNADPFLLKALKVPEGYRSLGIMTSDIDDISYAAIDEATKKAEVIVTYAHSMYAGSGNASTELEVKAGIVAFSEYVQNDAFFYSANDSGSIPYFAHTISRTGSYLSGVAGVPEGTPMAYLIAPPNEAICGLDEALKAAEVEMKVFYGPPTETNFAGGLLVGDQAACRAACEAFARTVMKIAETPKIL